MPHSQPYSQSQKKFVALYIEDNISNIELMDAIFALRPEVELVIAVEGETGLALAQQHHPDVILLDLHLPGASGQDLLAHIQENPAICDIPVVIVSADATTARQTQLMGAGATAYFTKPLNVRDFLWHIDAMLEKCLSIA